VAVEVVGLEVEQHRDVAAEVVHVLQREARELADDPCAGCDLQRDLAERRVFVPGQDGVAASRLEHRAEETHRGGLPFRPRDAQQGIPGQEPVAELDLAPDRDSAGARGRDGRRPARHTWALHDHVHVLQQVLLLGPEQDFDTGLGKPAGIQVGPPVCRAHLLSAPREGQRCGLPGAPQADD